MSFQTNIIHGLLFGGQTKVLKEQEGGNINVTTEVDGEWAKITIADDGIGIPDSKLSQVFDPFFTTKEVGKGTGLGLSICYGIITAHNGAMSVENNEKGGATFTVYLPLARTRAEEIISLEIK